MKNIIKRILKEHIQEKSLLVEKRIGQIVAKTQTTYMFEVVKTVHSFQRAITGRTDVEGYIDRPVANKEVTELVSLAKDQIAEKIASHEIVDGQDFAIKCLKWELALGIKAQRIEKTYWKFIVKTVFRETDEHHLFVGKDEVVFWV